MKNITQRLQLHLPLSLLLSAFALLTFGALSMGAAAATAPNSSSTPRIAAEIDGSRLTPLPGSKSPLAQAQFDTGRLPGSTRLQGISIYFSRTPAQEAAVKALIASQQNPSSPQYHQWLTPEQFAAQFGLADADIAKVQSWLEQQGFSIDSVNRSKNGIHFSGTASQVEAAFATEMHSYAIKTPTGAVEKHFAPSKDLSVPAALAGVVLGIRNLDDFKPRSHVVHNTGRIKPKYTLDYQGEQYVFYAPGDIATVYDIDKEYNAGYTGTGQTIVIIGQSAILNSDIEAFQSAAGLPVKDPTLFLVPNTGSSTVQADGDETESDIDLEWSGGIAKGATIDFVYTGSDPNYGVFDSLQYAIDQKIGTIISSSYGNCELEIGTTDINTIESSLEQAASQGQTVISAAGDSGSTDCYGNTDLSDSQQTALAVDYPASSPNVTALGGTEILQGNSAYLTAPSAYWESATASSPITTSALQYIPEQAWNEDSAQQGLASGGGGASIVFSKPVFQSILTPADNARDVPDISLAAATANPGLLFCSSDETDWNEGQEASCNSGFLDAATLDPTVAGGTSFAAPSFAGILALINQQQGYTTGQGIVNTELYALANPITGSTYTSAFHDIITGNNDCTAGSNYCTSTAGFSAGSGYDQATGLGSLDVFNLAAAWPANTTSTLIATTTTVTAANSAPALNAADNFTISVASDTGTTVPTGTVSIAVDGGAATTETLTANGTYVYSATFATAGSHEVVVSYSGDATHATSTGSATVNVAGSTSGTGSFTLAATSVTVAQGSSVSSTITVTPAGGYTGTVDLSFDTSNDNALQNLCYEFTNTTSSGDGTVAVTGTAAVTTALSFDTNAADCVTADVAKRNGKHAFKMLHAVKSASNATGSGNGGLKTAPAAIAFAGLLLAGLLGRYAKRFRGLACLLVLALAGLAISACGGGGNSNTISDPPKGTYTITLTGQDNSTASINATTTFTFTID